MFYLLCFFIEMVEHIQLLRFIRRRGESELRDRAAIGATAIGALLAEQVFQFEVDLRWSILPLGAVLGALLATLAGALGLRSVAQTPPLQTLRETTH